MLVYLALDSFDRIAIFHSVRNFILNGHLNAVSVGCWLQEASGTKERKKQTNNKINEFWESARQLEEFSFKLKFKKRISFATKSKSCRLSDQQPLNSL